MTQERLQEIKHQIADYQRRIDNRDMFDNIGYMELLEELISAVEELQEEKRLHEFTIQSWLKCEKEIKELKRIPQLIQAIFEAGGDLESLQMMENNEFYVNIDYSDELSYFGRPVFFKTLIAALEFILERTKEKYNEYTQLIPTNIYFTILTYTYYNGNRFNKRT